MARRSRSRWRTLALALAASTAAGVPAPASAEPAKLPAPTLSSTTLRIDEPIDVAGTGCTDPTTSTGAGLHVIAFRWWDYPSRGGPLTRDEQTYEVAADGSYSGSFTAHDPLFDSSSYLTFACYRGDAPPSTFEDPALLSATNVDVTFIGPRLPDQTVAAGGTFDLTLPCAVPSGPLYGALELGPPELEVVGGAEGRSEGTVVSVRVATTTAPGEYETGVACIRASEQPGSTWTFTLTVTKAAPATTGGTAADPPAPATPVSGRSSFTG